MAAIILISVIRDEAVSQVSACLLWVSEEAHERGKDNTQVYPWLKSQQENM